MNNSPPQSDKPDEKSIYQRVKEALLSSADDYRLPLGEVLRKKKVITDEQLAQALEIQQDKLAQLGQAVRLGMVIVEQGFVDEKKLLEIINEHYKVSAGALDDDIRDKVKQKRREFTLPKPRLPIWLQLSLAVTLIILGVIVTFSYVTLNKQKSRLYLQAVRIGMVSLNYFVNNARYPLLEGDSLRLNSLINDAEEVEGILYAIIVNHERKIVAHTDINQLDKPFNKFQRVQDVTKQGQVVYFTYLSETNEPVLNLSQPVILKNTRLGEVHVGLSIGYIYHEIAKERNFIIIMTLVIVILGILVAIVLGFWFSLPISRVLKATLEISKGNYKHRVQMNRKDELGNLGRAFNRMSEDLQMKEIMQESFGKYVGPEVLDMIMANPNNPWLKGRRSEATVVFVDIRGFTTYSEVHEPEDVVEALNQYFEIASKTILEYDGYIDKFIGDAVLAVFGVPVNQEKHAQRAIHAALAMQQAFAKAGRDGNQMLCAVGIAIMSGIVVSGNLGSQVKMEYTVIGDTVNVASRLNSLAGAGEIVVGGVPRQDLENQMLIEQMPPQKIRGRSLPVEVFKIIGIEEETQ